MPTQQVADVVKLRLAVAARELGAADPLPYVGNLIERTFPLPAGSAEYANNSLTPGAAPFEPSFSERDADSLRFTLSPLPPEEQSSSRRDEATGELRRLVALAFGRDVLRSFDERSEPWRAAAGSHLQFGAWLGFSFDRDGLSTAKIYYEVQPGEVDALAGSLGLLTREVTESLLGLEPVFTTIQCRRGHCQQRVTFRHLGVEGLCTALSRSRLSHQLPSIAETVGLCLGRWDLPDDALLLGIGTTPDGVELGLEMVVCLIAGAQSNMLDRIRRLLSRGQGALTAFDRWLRAFTPEGLTLPGDFSVFSIRVTSTIAAQVSLYLRPIELECRKASVAEIPQRWP